MFQQNPPWVALPVDTQLTCDVRLQGETVEPTWREACPMPTAYGRDLAMVAPAAPYHVQRQGYTRIKRRGFRRCRRNPASDEDKLD